MKTIQFVLACTVFVCGASVAQTRFSSLEELMTGQEFNAAGLEKLSDEELERLNAWLRNHIEETAPPPTAYIPEPGFEDRDDLARQEFRAVIPGEFKGWTGNTVFELANGQVWKQVSGGSYRANLTDPVVILYPAAFGSWRLRLEDVGPSIGVVRIK